jgi:hypothetical protein
MLQENNKSEKLEVLKYKLFGIEILHAHNTYHWLHKYFFGLFLNFKNMIFNLEN